MEGIYKAGESLEARSTGGSVSILELIGSGGQGEVYRVRYNGKDYALKWYFDHTATADQKANIEKLVEDGPPGKSFLWPTEICTSAKEVNSFGYLMDLREERFRSFLDVVTAKVDPTFEVLMSVGLNLVDSFHNLHARGLCYRDISFGNGFFDPSTGETLICDNDNVSANNSPSKSVLGTPDFMAPEVVLRQAHPSRLTDYFSLSVLLFYLFHIQHPLLGKNLLGIRSWDLPARERLFGSSPVFIFDPNDKSNEAIDDPRVDPLGEAGKNAILYWRSIYPDNLKDAFTRCFTEGIRNPEERLVASVWKKVLTVSANSITRCACGVENFMMGGVNPRSCWKCGFQVAVPFVLQTESQHMVASDGKWLLESHLSEDTLNPLSKKVGKVVSHPTRTGVLGLRNETSQDWTAQAQGDSQMFGVPPGKSVPLTDGVRVNIGRRSVICRKLETSN